MIHHVYTRGNAVDRPAKPSPDFPLFPHASGKWAKKIDGKTRYFGKWDDPDGALAEYRATCDSVSHVSGLTILDASHHFLTAKDEAVSRRELSQHSFGDYRRTCAWLMEHLGKDRTVESVTPSDFSAYKSLLGARRTVGSLGNEITRVRVFFKWLYDQRLISAPPNFGPEFKKPSTKSLRKHRREQGKKLFEPWQVNRLLDESGVHFRAMVLLGINCGFGNEDCAMLPIGAVSQGWIDFPRPKTEVDRRIPLWPETVAALQESLSKRPEPEPAAANRFFVRYGGKPWNGPYNHIAKRFNALLKQCGLSRGGFYWLRHTFATVAGGCKDQVATDAIMGHVDSRISAHYREQIDDDRLLAVVDHVRGWLFS